MDKKIHGTGKIYVTFWNDRTPCAKSNIPDPLQYPWPVPFPVCPGWTEKY